jgi:hypothetical protein
MPGPPPKHSQARRRRNAPAGGEWVDLVPLAEPVLRELPARSGEGDWTPEARATWESWRQDPVTTQWTPADTNFALQTLYLADAWARAVRSSFAAEDVGLA